MADERPTPPDPHQETTDAGATPAPGGVPPLDGSTVPDLPIREAVIPPPPAPDAVPDAVIPPPPAPDAVPDALLAPPLGAEPHARPPLPEVESQDWPVDSGPSPSAGAATPASGSYRVLAAVIFSFLFLLLGGAIALVVYLAGHTSFSFPGTDAGSDSAPEPSTVTVDESATTDEPATDGEPVGLTGEPCSDFCLDVSGRISEAVVGADSGSMWQVSQSWTAAENAGLPAQEATAAEYRSDAGTLTFTVWRFDDDTQAQAAFDDLTSGYGDAVDSSTVYEDGRGEQRTFSDGSEQTIVWVVLGDGGQPWVMQVSGPGDPSVRQFYLALPL